METTHEGENSINVSPVVITEENKEMFFSAFRNLYKNAKSKKFEIESDFKSRDFSLVISHLDFEKFGRMEGLIKYVKTNECLQMIDEIIVGILEG